METIYKINNIYNNKPVKVENTYKIKQVDENTFKCDAYTDTLTKVLKRLEKNEGYHIRIIKTKKCIVYIDFDKCENTDIFNKFILLISVSFDVSQSLISYTYSKTKGLNSYHITIPTIETTPTFLHSFFSNKLFSEYKNYIDMSIYSNKWFRLPNQTNLEKINKHTVINGEMVDFLIHNLDKVKETIDETTETQTKTTKTTETTETPIFNNTINLSKEETIILLLNMLSVDRFNNYPTWFNIGCLIYSLNLSEGYDIFNELSKKSIHYKDEAYIKEKYDTITLKKYTLKTLKYWAKMDNPNEYNLLITKYLNNDVLNNDEPILNKLITINKRYLIDIDDPLKYNNTTPNSEMSTLINKFFTTDVKSLNIRSPYDTGKTQMIKKIIEAYEPKRILLISYRISLTNDMKGNFKEYGVKSYLDGEIKADRLIIQLESLHKLSNDGFIDEDTQLVPLYDLVIIDEIESVLSQFNSPTFKGQSKETFNFLEEIINNSKKLLTLDGDISNRTYNYINTFGDSLNIVNEAKPNIKTFKVINNISKYDKSIFKQLDNNNKIVIVSQSKNFGDDMYNILKNKYPNKVILVYNSLSNDADKMALEDVNNIWDKCDILIYSPTIEAGVNFDKLHFNKIYGFICENTTSQRSFLQMLARVRKTTDNEIIILNKSFKMNDIKQYITYNDEVEAIKELNTFKMSSHYKTFEGVRVKKISYDNYTTNYIYNKMEEANKKPYYFLSKLKAIIEAKGHAFIFNKTKKLKKQKKGTVEIYNEIVETKLIKIYEYTELNTKKMKNEATREDKLLLYKYYLCHLLGVDKLTYDIIKFWYNNKAVIYNFINLIDTTNFKHNNEASNIISFEKLLLVNSLIKDIGFNNIFDNTYLLTAKQILNNFENIYKTNKLFSKKSKLTFGVEYLKYSKDTTLKQILGSINSILSNYSMQIKYIQKTVNNEKVNFYNISILNDVDELLKYKLQKGYKMNDTNNIFKCTKTKLKDLYIEPVKEDDNEYINFTEDDDDILDDDDDDDDDDNFDDNGKYICEPSSEMVAYKARINEKLTVSF